MIKTEIKGNTLTITADLDDANFKPSNSGKSKVLGTGGFVVIPGRDNLKYGLNIIKK